MGSLSNKHIANLAVALQKRFNIENFVETGTYLGETTQWASNFFKKVHSIEASSKYFKIASDKLQNFQNITLHFGISTDVLPKILKKLNGSSFFWLDAHWSGGGTFRGKSECPLIQEIKLINSYSDDKFIFIDDAHMFLSPPPLPHNPDDWPSIDELIFALQTSNLKSYIVIYEDVIIYVPFYAKALIEWYCRELTNEDLLKTIEPEKFAISFNTLYVIGAHKFQEYHILTEKFPLLKNIYLFEPLPHLQQFLKELEIKDPRIKVFPYAIGNNDSTNTFFITNNDGQSSSLLNMRKHKEIFPHVKVISEIEVQVQKLETVIRENSLELPDIIYLDTQGAEFLILSSIPADILKNIKIIYTECSTDEIYEGSTHLNEIIKFLEPFFDFINFYPLTKNYPTHGDALFYNRNFLKKDEPIKNQYGFISKGTHSSNTNLSKEKLVEHFVITNNEPLVTIFIPVYNREKYLADTLDSLLNQTYKNFEIIIADDGSIDGTLSIAKKYVQIDSRIKVFSFPHRGEVFTRNDAIQKANPNTKYFMNHDSDDISLPNKLEKLVKYLEEHPEISIVGCFAEYFDDAGNYLGKPKIEYESKKIRETFGQVNSMINSASLIRREVFKKIGYYRPEYASADDYDFFARALIAGFEMANLPEVLHRIRLHPNSISSQKAQVQQIIAAKIQSEYQSQMAKSLSEQSQIDKIYKPKPIQLNILHTVEFYYPHIGGSEIVIQKISEELLQRGHLVTVATSKLPERGFSELNGVTIVEFDIEGKLSLGIRGREISKYLNFLSETKFDVMLNYAAQQVLTDLAFLAIDEVHSKRVNCIATVGFSGLLNENQIRWLEFLGYYKNIIPQTLPKYDAVIAHSTTYQDYKFCKKINLKNLVVIPNAIDADEFLGISKINFREKYNIQTKYIGLCVANYYPDKGHETLVKSIKLMNRNDFTLVLIGKDGEVLPKLKKMSEGLNILILRNIPREDVVSAFQNADIFMFASTIEAFPLVLLEAMISKTPFVSTDCGNAKELKGGIVCREDEISKYSNILLDDENYRKRLAEEGFNECLSKYTWEKVVDQYEELYLRKYFEKFPNRKIWIGASMNDTKQFEILNTNPPKKNKIAGVVFSKDRAMQLEAGIGSLINHCSDFSALDLFVLYNTSTSKYQEQYELLIYQYENFQNIKFYKETSFKENLISIIKPYDYVLFLVDDNIFIRDFSILKIINILEANIDVLGFSLRLGKNTTYCYMLDKKQEVPNFQILNGCLKFDWFKSQYDFAYPLELSSSVYRVKDIRELILNETYINPNTLESKLASSAKKFQQNKPYLCCFETSVAFCNPVNIVQKEYPNRFHKNKWFSVEFLAQLFDYNYRIDFMDLDAFTPNSCHQEVNFVFYRLCKPKPLVSVIIPYYNLREYLPDAINSVINQTFKDWELIIVDDGSTIDAQDIARDFITSHPDNQIIFLRTSNNGLADARNAGISIARGKYILPLDADDMIASTFLEKTLDALEISNEIDIAYSDTQEFENRNNIVPAGKFDYANLPICNQLPYCSLFRRKVWEEVGGYNPNMKEGYEDWDFWVGAIEKGFKGKRIPEALFYYRIRSNSMLSRTLKFDIKLKAQIVLNHQSLYSKSQIEWAKLVISKFPDIHGIPNQTYFIPVFPDYIENIKSKIEPKVNDNKNPLVSVIVLAKYSSVSLSRCIQSILEQTYQNFEIIVVTDANRTLISNIESFKDKRIKYYINFENFRCNYLNFAISKENGIFIAYIDDSSIYYPNHLEILVNHLTGNNCKFAYTNAFRLIQPKIENTQITTKNKILHSFEFNRTKLLFENYIPICCVMHEKTLFEELGNFDVSLPDFQEWDLWIRFSRKYPFKHINQVTCEFSDQTNETTKWYNNQDKKINNKGAIYKKHKSFFLEDVQDAIANGKITEAEQIISKMMEIFDINEHPEPLIDLGVIRSLQGRIEEAKSIFTQVLKYHPTNQIARENYELISEIV